MIQDLIMRHAASAAPLGQSGIFVKPTGVLSVTGNYGFSTTNLENTFDGDESTYGSLTYGEYYSTFTAKFTFGMVHPGGKLRIKNKFNTAMYSPGGFDIDYSTSLDGSNPIRIYSVGASVSMANPVVTEFNIPGNIAVLQIRGIGGARYSGGTADIYDISLEL